jgi:hypothetical protein
VAGVQGARCILIIASSFIYHVIRAVTMILFSGKQKPQKNQKTMTSKKQKGPEATKSQPPRDKRQRSERKHW